MPTVEELYQANLRAGINREDALTEARIHAGYLGTCPPPAAPPAPVLSPAERFDAAGGWARLDDAERRAALAWERNRDPMRVAAVAAEELRLRTALDAIDGQLRPLQQRRAALVAELDTLLFHG